MKRRVRHQHRPSGQNLFLGVSPRRKLFLDLRSIGGGVVFDVLERFIYLGMETTQLVQREFSRFVQKFGRTHASNQLHPPSFDKVQTSLISEQQIILLPQRKRITFLLAVGFV
jgi:hypothetical protein